MTLFNEREEAFEKQFALDQDLRFKAMARRNKLLGLWVAERLGKSGADAEAYARSLILADFHEPGDVDVIRKVHQDLGAAGQVIDEASLRSKINQLAARAVEEIKAGQ